MPTKNSVDRRGFCLRTAAAVFALGLVPQAFAQRSEVVTVYKSPTCGCCGDWVKHLRGVPSALASCHTAMVGGYAIEGHVPAADIRRLLRERPKAVGLAVPGMVIGSPGMDQGKPEPYETLVFDERGHRVFARH